MKKLVNSIFAYFGQRPPFAKTNFERARKQYASLISIEQQAIDFVGTTLEVVNNALRSELQRNGYDLDKVRSGEIRVEATSTVSQRDKRFKSQVYTVDGFLVLRVNWKPNGFTLETNASGVATGQKKALKRGDGATGNLQVVKDRESREVEVEALAEKKLRDLRAEQRN